MQDPYKPYVSLQTHQLTESEFLLKQLLSNKGFKKGINNHYNSVITDLEIFATMKNDVTHASFKIPVNIVEEYLLKKKKELHDINQFLTKEEISTSDIINFAPRFEACLDFLSNEPYENYVHTQLEKVSRLQEIKLQRRAHLKKTQPANVKNIFKNSEFLQEKIDVAIFLQEMQQEQKQSHNPLTNAVKNKSFHEFIQNTQFCFEKTTKKNINIPYNENIEQLLKNSSQEKFKTIIKESQNAHTTLAWNESLSSENNIKEMFQKLEIEEEVKKAEKKEALTVGLEAIENKFDVVAHEDLYYEILGLKKSASYDEINKAYKFLSTKLHPDKNLDTQETAAEKFKKLKHAHTVLSAYTLHQEKIHKARKSTFNIHKILIPKKL